MGWLLIQDSEEEPEGILLKVDDEPVITWVNTGKHFYINKMAYLAEYEEIHEQ